MLKNFNTIRKIIIIATTLFYIALLNAQPVGVTWQWVNPLPNGNPIKAIAHDGTNFVAVGSNQSVRRSATALAGSWSAEVSLGAGTANDIIWASPLFVLVGDNGVIKTSPDGITWTNRNSTTSNNLKSVIYTGTTLVVVGDNSTVLASVDAITWVAGTLPSASNLNGVVWNGSILAAAGTIGKIFTSSDALNWTERVAAAGTTFNDITASGQLFVAVGNSGAIYSSNSLGTVWNQQANGFGAFNLISAAWDGPQFIATANSGLILTSPLGAVWSLAAQIGNGGSLSDLLVLPVAVTAGKYFAVGDGGTIYSSANLATWIIRQPESSVVADNSFDDISFNGSQYLAVGTSAPVASSTDGISWTQISTNAYASVVWDGAQYIGVGNSTKSGTSPDGITWTDHNLPANFNLQKVIIAHNGNYIAVGDLGDILTSIDANTWVQNTPTTAKLNGIAASTTTTFIVGANGTALSSPDLLTWTQQTLPNLGVKELTDIVFGNNQFVAVGTASLIYTSPDSITWTERTLAQQHNFTGVTWDGNQYLAVGMLGEILTSIDGITWTVQTSVTVNNLSAITSDSIKAVAVGTFGTILLSQAVNQAPVPTAPAITTNEDTSATSQVTANDPDLGDTFSYTVTTAATNGIATINAAGLANYAPNANFNGSDSFVITVTDSGGLTGTVTINATINPVNDPPAPTAANINTIEDTSATSLVSPNDPDVGNTFSYTITANATNGIATVGAGGLAGYLPAANFNGSDSFVVTVTDNTGLTGTVTINVTVNAVNDPPVPTAPVINTNEDTMGSSQIAANDPDIGDTFTYAVSTAALNGTVTINASGLASYTPNANFNGSDSFVVVVTDAGGLSGSVTINTTVNPVNDPPAPTAANINTIEDTSATSLVSPNDPDVGNTFSYTITANATNGIATVGAGGLAGYLPAANFNGSDSFVVTVTDNTGLTGTVTINVTVNAVNDPPVPTAPVINTNEDTMGSSQIAANDPDIGDTFTYAVSTAANNGAVTISASGLASYVPNTNFNGGDSFVVRVTDAGGLSGSVAINVTINPVNDAPVPTAANLIVNENMSGTVQVNANDPDIGDTFSYSLTTSPLNGTASVNVTGLVSYTPNVNFNGADSITIRVTDAAGATATVTINISVNAVNQPPVPTAPALTSNEDTSGSVMVLANDPDLGDSFTFTISTAAKDGTATIDATGLASYTPNANFNGNDTFTVTVTDAGGLSGVVPINVTISPVNDAPTVTVPVFSVPENGNGSVQLTVTDPDVGDSFSYAVTLAASNGSSSVDANGLVSYTPNATFNGTDSFTVTVTDAGGLTGVIDINVTVIPVNTPPVVTIPTITVNGRQVTMQINVTDVDVGDTHRFDITTPPQHGNANVSATGLVSYTADSGYLGDDSLTVTVTDSAGAAVQVSASFSITENTVSNVETNVSNNGTRGGSMGWLLLLISGLGIFRKFSAQLIVKR